ncbi:MAG: GreA/GreB family elongation factor, partial [Parachlamydiaceae bacterium]|nr:GreA/GreB family elongation factor [Parachlamydiaceae bacterium]
FLTQIKNRDFNKFLVLWEEYSSSDTVEVEEFNQLLKAIKSSDFAPHFGQMIETALPLWKTIQDENDSYEILKLLIDLQVTNSPLLADIVVSALSKKYENDPKFQERIKLIGMRNKDNFQGALSKYDLCAHMKKGNIVFHGGGWGTGEITEVSAIREHLVIDFENVSGLKDISFQNAFKTLIPLPNSHFLARRFSNPDLLEKEGKADPVKLIQLLLHDLGPLTASEIKDELSELVIPEQDWTKWWQSARAKIKKHPLFETPDSLKEQFYLRKGELSPEDRFQEAMQNITEVADIIQSTYHFVRDTPAALKNTTTKDNLQAQLVQALEAPSLSNENEVQILLLLDLFFNETSAKNKIKELILSYDPHQIEQIILGIDIVAMKKQMLLLIKAYRTDWTSLFLSLLFSISQAQLRDYILKELNQDETLPNLKEKLKSLVSNPAAFPEMFVWYFQKLVNPNEKQVIPFQNQEGVGIFFEAFFILYSILEGKPEHKDLVKKMYAIISAKRYELIRRLLQGTSMEFAKEFLLLVSKCQSLSDHDMKILRSLVEVVHPSLISSKQKSTENEDNQEIWTTEEGYLKIQDRIRHIGTIEVVENAREIEAARALGDLRENSEFKFAQEKRVRLQSELKTLSDQLNHARIITPEDIHPLEVGVGNCVVLEDSKGIRTQFTILGPWDADAENNILSFNSKFALEMTGKKQNEVFHFRDETYKIVTIGSYLKK